VGSVGLYADGGRWQVVHDGDMYRSRWRSHAHLRLVCKAITIIISVTIRIPSWVDLFLDVVPKCMGFGFPNNSIVGSHALSTTRRSMTDLLRTCSCSTGPKVKALDRKSTYHGLRVELKGVDQRWTEAELHKVNNQQEPLHLSLPFDPFDIMSIASSMLCCTSHRSNDRHQKPVVNAEAAFPNADQSSCCFLPWVSRDYGM
jgi:hypothetical protein